MTRVESARLSTTCSETPSSTRPSTARFQVKVEATNSAVRLSVADDGPGLQPDEVEHVFDRFFQADLSRTGQGAGLGLSIVEAIAEAHGGRTWVESIPGVGSMFYFELPKDSHDADPSFDEEPDEVAEQSAGEERVWFGVTR